MLKVRLLCQKNYLKKKAIKSYIKDQLKKADSFFKECNDKKNIHYLRMTIKKMMYVYNVLPKNLKESLRIDVDYIHKFQEKAGEWHDSYSAISFLKPISSIPQSYLTQIRSKEEKQFRDLLNDFKENRKHILN